MNSPLILLVFWFVINILIKSAKDKKKIEEARRKRAQQIESNPMQNKNIQTIQRETPNRNQNQNKNKSIIDVFKDEIEKEIQREKQKKPSNTEQNKPIKTEQSKPIKTEQKLTNKKFVSEDVIERDSSWRDNYFSANTDIDFDNIQEEIKTYHRKYSINVKKDLLKGIIFSEVLSEPKGMKSGKRGM